MRKFSINPKNSIIDDFNWRADAKIELQGEAKEYPLRYIYEAPIVKRQFLQPQAAIGSLVDGITRLLIEGGLSNAPEL